MKVLHLIDHMGLGGAQNCLLDLLEARGPQIDATVWSLSDRMLQSAVERLTSAGVPYRTLGLSKLNPLGFFKLRMLMKRERPDLLHMHLEFSNTFGAAAALTLSNSRPLLVGEIVNDPFQAYSLLHRVGGRILALRMDAHIAISASIRDSANLAYRGRPRCIKLIQRGLNLCAFDRRRTDPARVKHFRAGAGRVVGTVGRLADQKAFHVLLEAIPRLLAVDPETRVLIVGDGPRRRALEKQSRRLGISHAVAFVGYQSDVALAYGAMDVFVLPSLHEGFGVVFLEAMAMGVPVVGTRVIGAIDAVRDGVTGLLVPFGDPAALAAAILRLFSEPNLRRTLCENAKELVRKAHSREKMAAQTEALYLELEKGIG